MVPGGVGAGAVSATFSPSEPWAFAWKVITKRFTQVALPLAVGFIAQSILANIVSGGGGVMLGVLTESGVLDPDFVGIMGIVVNLVGVAVSLLVSAFMTGGLVTTALKAARGQPTSFGDPFSGGKYFGQMLVALIVGSIVMGIGYVLCIVPGVIVALGICLYPMLIVDQGMPGVDALKKSWEMTKGHKLNIFLMGLIGFFVFLAGALACGIGALLVSMPMAMVSGAWLYMRLKGETISEPV